MENLESIFNNFSLKIKVLYDILKLIKPQVIHIVKPYDPLFRLFEIETKENNNIGYDIKQSNIILNALQKEGLSRHKAKNMEEIILYYAFDHRINVLPISTYDEIYTVVNTIDKLYKNKAATLIRNWSKDNPSDIIADFNRFLSESGSISKLNLTTNIIINSLQKINKSKYFLFNVVLYSREYEQIKENIHIYDNYRIEIENNLNKTNVCENCSCELLADSDKGELYCAGCGMLLKKAGDIAENSTTNTPDNKSKNSSYDASNHCEFWLKRLFALEPTELDDNIKETVEKWLRKNNYTPTCRNIRKALQKTKLSNHNTHVSLIHKLITGKSPEPPTYNIKNIIFNYFNKAVQAYNIIKKDTNIKYYPYFIWKIMEMVYWKDPIRRTEILQYIHFQNHDTLSNNEKIWRQICDIVPEFTFIPTDPNIQYLYDD